MRHLLGSLALGCCSTFCLAAEPVAAAAPSIETLVQNLGSDSFAVREAAGKELLKIGGAALPAVKLAAATHADLEVRERAAALVEPLAKALDSGKLLTVKTVKIEYKDQPLTTVLNDFKTKTGLPVLLDKTRVKNDARLVTVPAGEYAPWEALEVVLKAAGLREDHRAELPAPAQPANNSRRYYSRWDYGDGEPANYNPNTAPLVLVDGDSESLPSTRSGAVRVTALPPSFAKNRVIRGAGRIEFHLDVAPQPGLGWNSATGVRVTHAEDEDGRPIFSDLKLAYDPMASQDPWNNPWGGGFGRRRVFFGGGGWAWTSNYGGMTGGGANDNPRLLTVSLRTNDRAVAMLRKFEGVVTGDVHTPNVPVITIDSLETANGKSFAGPLQSNMTIVEAKLGKDGVFTLHFKYESLTAWALQQQAGGLGNFVTVSDNPSDVLQKIKYFDTEGKALTPTSNGTSTSSDGFRQSCEVTYKFKKTEKPPVRMLVNGIKVSAVEVPFKLVNVRVP